MYKRHTGQLSMLDDPEFFGSLPLDPNNHWIKLSKQIPWHEFDLKYNSFSKARKKTGKMIRKVVRQQLGYLKRNLGYIDAIAKKHPDCLKQVLNKYKAQCLEVIRLLFTQQQEMFQKNTHKVENRIVSISQPWVRPIVRGKQNAEVEFGAKVEMSVVNGFLRIESLRWDAFNECTTLQESVASTGKHMATIRKECWPIRFSGPGKT